MYVEDDLSVRSLLLTGVVTVAEARAMHRDRPVVRDFVDSLLLELCRRPLGDNGKHAFVSPFESFVRLLGREREATLARLPSPVAEALSIAAEVFTRENRFARAADVLSRLGGPAPTDRGRALALHTRVGAARIRDGITHPVIGLTIVRYPTLRDTDVRTPEATAITEAEQLYRRCCDHRQHRRTTEQKIVGLAHRLTWPE